MNTSSFNEVFVTMGRVQVEYQNTVGRKEFDTTLTVSDRTKELLRLCTREKLGYKCFKYLEANLINDDLVIVR